VRYNNGFFEDLANSAPVVGLCVEAANRVADAAKSTGPKDTLDYVNSIHVEVVPHRQIRSVALVVADDPKSMLIESKTGNLARAVKAAARGR